MKSFRIKTNLKCSNCVAKVQQSLDATSEIKSWSVDLKSPDRVLTIEADEEHALALAIDILAKAGYRAVELK